MPIPHIGPLTKVIRLKLFLDVVPSSFEDITRVMCGQPKRLSRTTGEKMDLIEHYCTQFESISMQGKSQNYIQNKKLNAWSYLYGHNSIDIIQVSTTFKRKATGH